VNYVSHVTLRIKPMKLPVKASILTISLLLLPGIFGAEKHFYQPSLGISLRGSSGLFFMPTAQTLDVGHIRAGLLGGGTKQFIPYNLTLGLSPKVEIYLSHYRQDYFANTTLDESHIGTLVSILKWKKGSLAIDLISSNIKNMSMTPLVQDHDIIRASLVAEHPLGNLRTFAQVGVHERNFSTSEKSQGFYFGIAASRPLWKNIQIGSEFMIDGPMPDDYQTIFSSGFKAFILKHFQLGFVYSYRLLSGHNYSGIQLMGSLSTSPLSSFSLSNTSNLWLDFKHLLASIGLLSTSEGASNVLPEYFLGPGDNQLPQPPSLEVILNDQAADSIKYQYPEFQRPEKLKLIEPPPLESLSHANTD